MHSGMGFQKNHMIEMNAQLQTVNSVQANRKRRHIMHDNLTNSRGNSRLTSQQLNNDNMKVYAGTQRVQPIGAHSPPNMPQSNMKPNIYDKQEQSQNPNSKHFMQDAIERKIEKFSSQNANRRVNTSSKFRNQAHSIGNSLQGMNQAG